MGPLMELTPAELRRLIGVDGCAHLEIESKWKLPADAAKPLRRHLKGRGDVEALKRTVFFDQYLDTPDLDLLRAGASLRLRYRKNGSQVYLQYKGPGLREGNLHVRSEHRSRRLDELVLEESGSDLVRFVAPSVRDILRAKAPEEMLAAMRRDLGPGVVEAVDRAPLLCQYQKDLFRVELDGCTLTPSIDRLCAFRVEGRGPLALSTFWEYEDQADAEDLDGLLAALPALQSFDRALAEGFGLRPEPLDKYRRSASGLLLVPGGAGRLAAARPSPALV